MNVYEQWTSCTGTAAVSVTDDRMDEEVKVVMVRIVNCVQTFDKLCTALLRIMHAVLANYAQIMQAIYPAIYYIAGK